MKKQVGFTLIELVVVIILLGILAVIAAPKFLGIQKDARDARLEGMKGAIASALELGYGAMVIAGLENRAYVSNTADDGSSGLPKQDLPFDGCEVGGPNSCTFRYVYPDADSLSLPILVSNLSDQDETDWKILRDGSSSNVEIFIAPKEHDDKTQCVIRYGPPTSLGGEYILDILPCL